MNSYLNDHHYDPRQSPKNKSANQPRKYFEKRQTPNFKIENKPNQENYLFFTLIITFVPVHIKKNTCSCSY